MKESACLNVRAFAAQQRLQPTAYARRGGRCGVMTAQAQGAHAEPVAVTFHNRPFLVIHEAQGVHIDRRRVRTVIKASKATGRSARTACAEISGSVQGVVEKGVEKLLRGGLHAAVVTVRAEVCLRCGEHLYSKAQGAHDDQSFQGGGSSPQAGGSRVIGMVGQDPPYSADVRAYFARLHPM